MGKKERPPIVETASTEVKKHAVTFRGMRTIKPRKYAAEKKAFVGGGRQ